jgi:hypothetical protein
VRILSPGKRGERETREQKKKAPARDESAAALHLSHAFPLLEAGEEEEKIFRCAPFLLVVEGESFSAWKAARKAEIYLPKKKHF